MILFKPWVGSEYAKQPLKILIVGESYYGMPENLRDDNMGRKLIENDLHVRGDKSYNLHYHWFHNRFHYNVYKIFAGIILNEGYTDFYNKISFCNYMQDVLIGAGDSVLYYMRNDDKYKEYFTSVVENLRPTLVVLTSNRFDALWRANGLVEYLGYRYINIVHPSRIKNEQVKNEGNKIMQALNLLK